MTARRAVSLDQPPGVDDEADTLGTFVGIEEPGFETAEQSALLGALVSGPTDRDRLICICGSWTTSLSGRSSGSSGSHRCMSRACFAAPSRSYRKPPSAERDTLGAIPVSGHALPSPPLALQP